MMAPPGESAPYDGPPRGRVLPMMAYMERLPLKGVPFSGFWVVRKSVIWVCKSAQQGLQMNFMALKCQENILFL